MKKLFIISVLLLASTQGWSAPESKPATSPAGFSFKDVSSKTAEAFCAKMDQCSKEKIPIPQCNAEMKDTFQQAYDRLAADKKPQVGDEQLKKCVKSIQASTCETLKKASSLDGCDFISQLSS